MRKAMIAVVLAAGVAFTLVLPAQARLAKQGTKSTVAFAAKGSGGMTIVGTTSELSVRDDGRTLVFSVPLAKLTTGISLRDKHMREKYLQVGQYPAAELSVDRAQLRPPASGAVSADVSGTMKLHGKTRTVTVHYSAKKNGATIQVVGSTRLNIRDFGIEVPSFLGVTVKPDLDITVSLEVRDS